MKKILISILYEISPCSIAEIYDYIHSDLFFLRGNICYKDFDLKKLRYELERLVAMNPHIYKFQCDSGYKVRYGFTKFLYYLPNEPRFLRVKGSLKRCMFCGMPIYAEENHIFHFKYNCEHYHPQNHFRLIKINGFWVIISRVGLIGIIDDINSTNLRLPDRVTNIDPNNTSEWWLINRLLRKRGYTESEAFFPIIGDEYIS
jgi:hypothetical protein